MILMKCLMENMRDVILLDSGDQSFKRNICNGIYTKATNIKKLLQIKNQCVQHLQNEFRRQTSTSAHEIHEHYFVTPKSVVLFFEHHLR